MVVDGRDDPGQRVREGAGRVTRAPYDPREALAEVSEIIPRLFMGMRPKTYVGYDLVVSCEEHLARKPMEGYTGLTLHCPMRDEDDFPLNRFLISTVAEAIAIARRNGKVLVHCTGGLNRSGVVVARALQAMHGFDGAESVRIIRETRDEWALCNKAFERWVTGEKLPTAETSAFLVCDEAK